MIIPNICAFTVSVNMFSSTLPLQQWLEHNTRIDWWISYNLWYKHDMNYCNATLCHVSHGRAEDVYSSALTSFLFTLGFMYFYWEQTKKSQHFTKAGQIRLYVNKQYFFLHSLCSLPLMCDHGFCVSAVVRLFSQTLNHSAVLLTVKSQIICQRAC